MALGAILPPRRGVDIALGVTLVFAVALAGVRGELAVGAGLVLALLQATAGVLLLVRRPARARPGWARNIPCLASLAVGASVLHLVPAPAAWPGYAAALFVLGGLGASLSLASLGRSFGVLPAVREVVVRGPFAWVRHPAYACELLMVYACVLAKPSAAALAAALAATALVIARVRVEEDVLLAEPMYDAYAERVRFRLLPLLW